MSNPQSQVRKRYATRRVAEALAYLGGECANCGTVQGLEFDHIDPSTKVRAISTAIRWECWSWKKLVVELDKCQLLCSPCHIRKTRDGVEHKGGHNKILNPDHGTWAKYVNHKCKCDECRAWNRDYKKKLVDARGNPRI